MRDATVYWVNTTESEIHFIDAILSAYDGLANVRRDWRLHDGKMFFKIYVALGMEGEFEEVMDRLRERAEIGEVFRGEDDEPAASA
ncbi:DUF4911 domain-containing protein [Candidatus Bipolaricaulota bacterium]|jgi:hypothetical protein|nr:DUF4911 domain-containing protein [Candidatus Bipolaricaulota bacterium]